MPTCHKKHISSVSYFQQYLKWKILKKYGLLCAFQTNWLQIQPKCPYLRISNQFLQIKSDFHSQIKKTFCPWTLCTTQICSPPSGLYQNLSRVLGASAVMRWFRDSENILLQLVSNFAKNHKLTNKKVRSMAIFYSIFHIS